MAGRRGGPGGPGGRGGLLPGLRGLELTDAQREAYKAPVRKTFEDFANAYNFARNTWCDMVIEPAETRDVMALLLDLAGRVPSVPSRFGVFRM